MKGEKSDFVVALFIFFFLFVMRNCSFCVRVVTIGISMNRDLIVREVVEVVNMI